MSASPATQSLDKPTPILDRVQPMPKPEQARTSSYDWASQVLIGLITFLLVAFSGSGLPWLRQRVDNADSSKMGWTAGLLLLFAVAVMAIIVHELGHFFAGKSAGFRFRYICIGPIQLDHSFKLSYSRNRGTSRLGAVSFFPGEMRNHPWKHMLMVIAGPAANIVCAIVFLLPFDKSFFLIIFAGISAYLGIINLVPSRRGSSTSDGFKILRILFKRAKHERELAIVQILDEIKSGIASEALSAELVHQATAVRDKSWMTVMAYSIAYAHAYHQKDNSSAAYFLETRLTFSQDHFSMWHSAAIGDAAIFQAERRGNIVLAEQWLADLPDLDNTKLYRSQAEGAILEARGDFHAALKKISECEKRTQDRANKKSMENHLKRLHQWKQEVQEKLSKQQAIPSETAKA
ncbi:MAG TPA: M50 family metallopeptidase [Candidatus Angelobacter sp.]|nr:M50 family metallopeptidase [Candidatus Angelobacter sp.]